MGRSLLIATLVSSVTAVILIAGFASWKRQGSESLELKNSSATTDGGDYSVQPTSPYQPSLFISVMSSVRSNSRKVVRETWFQTVQKLRPLVQVKFVVGTKGIAPDELRKLKAEESKHHDMLFLANVEDGDKSISLKTLQTMVWIASNVSTDYVLMTHDQFFVHVEAILADLKTRGLNGSLYWGRFVNKKPVKDSAKDMLFPEENWFLCSKTYFPYALSGGYVLSMDVIKKLEYNAHMIQLYANEDISVSVWTSSFTLERKDDDRFIIRDGPCVSNSVLFPCGRDEKMMRGFHQHVVQTGTLC